ncbi:MAG: sulfatase-like hydrolase/transferase [Gammaproteobacteria bacterium]
MLKKVHYFFLTILISGFLLWEFKVNIIIWALPTVVNFINPVQDNIPTKWPEGPLERLDQNDSRPNIILILADDMGYNDISLHNGGAADGTLETPHIDSLAKNGVWFNKGYAANATCAPSRASIMTGRYATRFGFEFTPVPDLGQLVIRWLAEEDDDNLRARIDNEIARNLPSFMDQGMPSDQITIAEILKTQGYYTAHIGKWHLGHSSGMSPLDQGFDDSLSLAGTYYLPEDHPDVVNAKFETSIDKMVWSGGQYAARFNDSEMFSPDKYVTDYYTDEAIKVIEKNKNRPFFLYLSHWAIHNPLQAIRSDVEQMSHMSGHNLKVYSGMIRALDRSVGEIIRTLKELNIYGRTLIFFTSDNGGANYIELEDINKPFRGWKISFFEGGIRVPFILSWPDQIDPGLKFDKPVHHFDIFSTIASAANVQIPMDRKIDGVDLMPYIKGEKITNPHQTLFWRSGNHQAVLHENWKYLISKKEGTKWLFDTDQDPLERNNLININPEKTLQIESLLAMFNSEQANPLYPSSTELPVLIDKYDGQVIEDTDEFIFWSN